jgi:surfeit locus 1 family protein
VSIREDILAPTRRVIFVVAILGVATVMVSLGRWQLRRLHQRRATNAVLAAATALAPLVLPADLARSRSIDSGRRIVTRGHFDLADQMLLRGRVQNDGPGLQVITPFVLDSTAITLWVLRGFVPSPDAVTPPDTILAPATGTVEIRGTAFAIPVTSDSGAPLAHLGTMTWQRLDRDVVTRRRPGSLAVYLLLAGDSAGAGRLAIVAPTPLNDGPHLSYAIQWFGMALAVLTFAVIVLWRDGRGPLRPPAAP